MQSWKDNQRRYRAGLTLDLARDASLNTNKITTLHVIKGTTHSELLFFSFFWRLFFCALFLAQQITIMASVSKHFPSRLNRIGIIFFWVICFFRSDSGLRRPKIARKITMMASVSKRSGRPKMMIGKNIFTRRNFGLESALKSVPDFIFSDTYSGKETRK